MANIRKRHSREFKMKVVLDLLKGDKSLALLSSEQRWSPKFGHFEEFKEKKPDCCKVNSGSYL